MELAPIVLFVYNRPWHTEQTLNALMKNELADKSVLYIYSDGPKANECKEKHADIEAVRKIVKSKQWCKEVHIIESLENNGLANSVINGVTEIINKFGKIIVLEDDIITSTHFLEYMNNGLIEYKDVHNVYSVNGYMFPIKTYKIDTFLNPLATSSWGWGTWSKKWAIYQNFTEEDKEIIIHNYFLKERFNFANYDLTSILLNKNSWAINWYFSVFVRNGLGLFPTKSLVLNIGFDGSGTNFKKKLNVRQNVFQEKIIIKKKEKIELYYYKKLLDYFTHKKIENKFKKIKRFIKRYKINHGDRKF